MEVDVGALLDAGGLVLVDVVGAGAALRGLHGLAAFNKPDQPFLNLQIPEHLFFISHPQTHNTQSPSCR